MLYEHAAQRALQRSTKRACVRWKPNRTDVRRNRGGEPLAAPRSRPRSARTHTPSIPRLEILHPHRYGIPSGVIPRFPTCCHSRAASACRRAALSAHARGAGDGFSRRRRASACASVSAPPLPLSPSARTTRAARVHAPRALGRYSKLGPSTMASTGHASWQKLRRATGRRESAAASAALNGEQAKPTAGRRRLGEETKKWQKCTPAEDALGHVDVVARLARAVISYLRLDGDRLRRADGFAQLARTRSSPVGYACTCSPRSAERARPSR